MLRSNDTPLSCRLPIPLASHLDARMASARGPFFPAKRRWLMAGLFGFAVMAAPLAALAQEAPEAAACRKASIEALKRVSGNSPLKDVKLDLDSLTIAKADAEIGGAKVTTVIIGQAAIQREQSDESHTFLCLLGEKEKVLMTFFTKR